MIKVKENTDTRLVIEVPDMVHTFQTIFFLFIGVVITLAILTDPQAPKLMALLPALILALGIYLLIRGGKPDYFIVDKTKGSAEILLNVVGEKKKEPLVIDLDDIESTALMSGSYGSVGQGRSHSTVGIKLILKDGTEVPATPTINLKKKMEKIYAELKDFLGR